MGPTVLRPTLDVKCLSHGCSLNAAFGALKGASVLCILACIWSCIHTKMFTSEAHMHGTLEIVHCTITMELRHEDTYRNRPDC